MVTSDTLKGTVAAQGPSDVIYSYYPFISADTMPQLELEDVRYLERLGSYRVPPKPALDEFVQAYFRYIHPHQPIFDEGDFWRVYDSTSSLQIRTISIFVFQAMLFAACSVCPYTCYFRSPLLMYTVCLILHHQGHWLQRLPNRPCYILP